MSANRATTPYRAPGPAPDPPLDTICYYKHITSFISNCGRVKTHSLSGVRATTCTSRCHTRACPPLALQRSAGSWLAPRLTKIPRTRPSLRSDRSDSISFRPTRARLCTRPGREMPGDAIRWRREMPSGLRSTLQGQVVLGRPGQVAARLAQGRDLAQDHGLAGRQAPTDRLPKFPPTLSLRPWPDSTSSWAGSDEIKGGARSRAVCCTWARVRRKPYPWCRKGSAPKDPPIFSFCLASFSSISALCLSVCSHPCGAPSCLASFSSPPNLARSHCLLPRDARSPAFSRGQGDEPRTSCEDGSD